MLKKLLKYDLKYMFSVVVIFYGLSLVFALLTRIFLNIENSFIMYVIGQICNGCMISMIFNILINNLMRLWARFKQNFYGDESYLTHTLPIDKKTLYLSKMISTVITLFTSFLVIVLTIFIAYYSNDFVDMIKNILFPLTNAYNVNVVLIILAFAFIFFLEILNIVQVVYTGLILGHRKNNLKVWLSIVYGFVAMTISQLFVLLVLFIIALFNKDILNLIFTNELISMESTKIIIYMSIILYTIIVTVENIINIKLFKKGVDVD